jgi:hypothetical protein
MRAPTERGESKAGTTSRGKSRPGYQNLEKDEKHLNKISMHNPCQYIFGCRDGQFSGRAFILTVRNGKTYQDDAPMATMRRANTRFDTEIGLTSLLCYRHASGHNR